MRHYSSKTRPAEACPFSVSAAAWPALYKLGQERKTRVISEEGYLNATEPDSLVTSTGLFVFNRVSSTLKNGVFSLSDADAIDTQFCRLNKPIGWFELACPAIIYSSSEGLVPLTATDKVILTPAQLAATHEIADRSMTDVNTGRDSAFAAENVIIRKHYELIRAGVRGTHVFNSLAQTAHHMGMPRAKAFAEQTLRGLTGYEPSPKGRAVISRIIE